MVIGFCLLLCLFVLKCIYGKCLYIMHILFVAAFILQEYSVFIMNKFRIWIFCASQLLNGFFEFRYV